MTDLRRLGGLALTLAFVAACLATCEAALVATSPWWPAWLKHDWGCVEYPAIQDIGPRIAAIAKDEPPQHRPIGVLLGSSYQVTDIDLDALEAGARPSRRWWRLTVHGGSSYEVDRIAHLLMNDGKVKPGTVAITLGLKMLVRPEVYRKPEMTDLVECDPVAMFSDLRAIRPIAVVQLAQALVGNGFNALFPDRLRMNYRLNSRLTRARLALMRACGQGIHSEFAPSPDPRVEYMRVFARSTPDQLADEMMRERQEGKFDPAFYSPSGEPSRSLIETIRLVRSVGAEPVIVLMPERSTFRSELPPEARRNFLAMLSESFGTEAPRIIDLEAFAPDEEFLDLHHLDERGRARVTRRLIDELNGDRSSPTAGSRVRTAAST